MKKQLKRIGALVLTGVLVLGMSVTALAAGAADMNGKSGVIGAFETPDVATVQSPSVIIYKEITAYNPEGSTVNAPAVTFNYSITPGDAGKDIYDAKSMHDPETNAHVQTKAGVGLPTITGTDVGVITLDPASPTHQLKTSSEGTANRFPLTISFDGIFKTDDTANYAAGVYRYVITETTDSDTKYASGIKEGAVAKTLYMDVYVDGSGDIYGYTCFTNNDSIDAREDDSSGAATAAGKIEGFVGSKQDEEEYDSEAASIADKYYTFDLEVGKTVENDNYTKNSHHQFPFTVVLANSQVTAKVLPIMTVGEHATQTALDTTGFVIGTTIWNPTIADSATVKYVGIPSGTAVSISETNDVIGVSYSASSTGAETNAAAKTIATNDISNVAEVTCAQTPVQKIAENHTGSKAVIFTNKMLEISPTGVALRFAPYAVILAAGLALLFVSHRRRTDEEE